MGRKKSNFICQRCGDYGFKRTNPDAVVHYDSKSGKRRTCYYKDFLKNFPPKKHWRHTPLYDKLDDIQQHFERMALHISIVKNSVNKLPPDDKLSSKCIARLDMFDKHLLTPLEKLLIPYTDARWCANWTKWFKIQIDSFDKGARASGIVNAMKTGQYVLQMGKEPNTVIELPIAREFTSKEIKTNGKKIVAMARDIIIKDGMESALDEWSKKTVFEVITGDPDEFYRKEMASPKAKSKI